jgi:peptidoglycan/xylan/chitin deacetylase (PgdA/CDA1 family)
MTPSLVVYYHHVSEEPGDYTYVTPAELERQLRWLRQRWTPCSLEALGGGAAGFGVSFDDGYDDALAALGVLERLAVPATFFVLPAYAGQLSHFNRLGRATRHATCEDLLRLQAAGHTIGSHGLTHRDLTALDDEQLEDELSRSRAMLEAMLGSPVTAFAYPFGACDRRVAAACARWYERAWSTSEAKASRAASPLHAVPRAYLLADGEGGYRVVR